MIYLVETIPSDNFTQHQIHQYQTIKKNLQTGFMEIKIRKEFSGAFFKDLLTYLESATKKNLSAYEYT